MVYGNRLLWRARSACTIVLVSSVTSDTKSSVAAVAIVLTRANFCDAAPPRRASVEKKGGMLAPPLSRMAALRERVEKERIIAKLQRDDIDSDAEHIMLDVEYTVDHHNLRVNAQTSWCSAVYACVRAMFNQGSVCPVDQYSRRARRLSSFNDWICASISQS